MRMGGGGGVRIKVMKFLIGFIWKFYGTVIRINGVVQFLPPNFKF
jgi:hypothetical protein